MAAATWSTQQLAEFVAAVSAAESEAAAALAAVEHSAEALDADAAAIVVGGEVVAQVGYPRGAAPVAELEAVKPGVAGCSLEVPGVGSCSALAVTLEHTPGAMLVVAREGGDGMTPEEAGLLRGMARVTSLTMRMQRLLGDEQAAREKLERLAREHAALHRVATLVAEVAPPETIFSAVAEEVGAVIRGADLALVSRYEPGEVGKVVGAWSRAEDHELLGLQFPLGGRNIHTLVFETNRPARVDQLVDDATVATAIARETGARSSAGAPIVVSGRLWGVVIAASSRESALPVGTEHRLADFTELVATAIAKVQSREELRALAEEQAALRRVATLVAEGAPPDEIFAAVVDEVAQILGLERIEMARYEDDGTATVIAASGDHPFPPGSRWVLDGPSLFLLVRETGRPARIDDYGDLPGTVAAIAHEAGFRSAIGAPIAVDGRTWGAIIAISTEPEPIPELSESRLAQFTDLVATAIANAQSREKLRAVADEQAALRRVATLVAHRAPAAKIFDAVTEEVHLLLHADQTGLSRYDPDGLWTFLAVRGAMTDATPVGFRLDPGPSMPGVAELLSGRSVRVDAAPTGTLVDDLIRAEHTQAWVASPIVLVGRTWGQVAVFSRLGPLPAGTEERLANFTDLVATAIANAQARDDLRTIADEQAALRRVATLVAEAAPHDAVFTAVAEEVGRLVSADRAYVGRYEANDTMTHVASWSATGESLPVGIRAPGGAGTVSGLVRETGRPARVDRYTGDMYAAAREHGIGSAVAAPITVEGRPWGVIGVASTGEEPPPPDTEARLAGFTELVASAIGNAQTRGELEASRAESERAAEEQAALRRVATLVARVTPPTELFAAVAEEVGRVVQADRAFVSRYEIDDAVTIVASWTASGEALPVDVRFPIQEYSLSNFVRKTGQAVRIDAYPGGRASPVGNRAAVAAPIAVEGRLWGLMSVGSNSGEPSPPGTEGRLARFTELVATAIANAQAREELRLVAEEQAALRRVATLVAEGASPAAIFEAVAEELGRLVESDRTLVARYETDNTVTILAGWSRTGHPPPVGVRGPIDEHSVTSLVRKTGRVARMDAFPDEADGLAALVGNRSAVGAPITVSGRLWGLMVVGSGGDEPPPPGTEERLTKFTELVATAIANAEAQAELTASRARIVATADETRRRIERDLHDGAQQRLVSLALRLRAAQAVVPPDLDELDQELNAVARGLGNALDELREFARGIHPAILSEGGLAAALKSLARRSAVPVELSVRIDERPPEAIEVGAYYVVTEALANTAKHATASVVSVEVTAAGEVLRVGVRDDGVGGAHFARGSGLIGLRDRVEALGGRIVLESPPGQGTSIEVELPLRGETGYLPAEPAT